MTLPPYFSWWTQCKAKLLPTLLSCVGTSNWALAAELREDHVDFHKRLPSSPNYNSSLTLHQLPGPLLYHISMQKGSGQQALSCRASFLTQNIPYPQPNRKLQALQESAPKRLAAVTFNPVKQSPFGLPDIPQESQLFRCPGP